MKEEIKKLWVEALRSGKYQQGTGCLRSGAKFCCLGVLCDLHLQETDGEWALSHIYHGETALLPPLVCDWAGLQGIDPKLDGRFLSAFNDAGSTFPEIADLIEKHL